MLRKRHERQLCNCILQMWRNINISIIHHINHGIISPYCFIRPAMYCRCELVSTIHISTYQKASFQWATFRHLYSDKHVTTHQRYVLSLLHGWDECSSPPLCWTTPARAEGFSFTAHRWSTWAPSGSGAKKVGLFLRPIPDTSVHLYFACWSAAEHCSHQDRTLLLPHETHFKYLNSSTLCLLSTYFW